jgi:hypothetical protein
LHLVGILFPHIIDDERSKPHKYREVCYERQPKRKPHEENSMNTNDNMKFIGKGKGKGHARTGNEGPEGE